MEFGKYLDFLKQKKNNPLYDFWCKQKDYISNFFDNWRKGAQNISLRYPSTDCQNIEFNASLKAENKYISVLFVHILNLC